MTQTFNLSPQVIVREVYALSALQRIADSDVECYPPQLNHSQDELLNYVVFEQLGHMAFAIASKLDRYGILVDIESDMERGEMTLTFTGDFLFSDCARKVIRQAMEHIMALRVMAVYNCGDVAANYVYEYEQVHKRLLQTILYNYKSPRRRQCSM
jgi:hypothetical protein